MPIRTKPPTVCEKFLRCGIEDFVGLFVASFNPAANTSNLLQCGFGIDRAYKRGSARRNGGFL